MASSLLLTVLGPVAHAEPSKADVNRALGGLQIPFIENHGQADALAVSASDVYVTGITRNADFPGTAGGAQATHEGEYYEEAFVARLNLGLTEIIRLRTAVAETPW